MKSWIRAAGIAAVVACTPVAFAQKAGPVETQLEARKVVVAADGKDTYAAAGEAKPGDTLEYVATYRNSSKEAVRNLDATLPIPRETEFVPGTEVPGAANASTDGVAFAPIPLTRKVQRDGREVQEAVPTSEYRFLRWHVDSLAGEKSVAFKARVRVIADRSTGPPAGQGGSR